MEEKEWAQQISEKIKQKLKSVAPRTVGKLPYTTVNGVFDDWTDKNVCWWTNGFWGGMLWQLYHATGEEAYKVQAIENEEKLDRNLMAQWGMDHDSGFKWLTTAIAHDKVEKNEASRNRGLLAANNLAGRFNPVGKFIRAWNDDGDGGRAGWAIIDCMMNLPLLYWAKEQTNDPRFLQIATMHADTAERYFVRGDGSCCHIVEFDPATGEFVKSHGGQGCAEGSSWTRGQAWGLYGFTLSYLHTKKDSYFSTAKRIANYFIANIPTDGHIPVDFRQPVECVLEDSTAAAIAACGLLELAKQCTGREQKLYHDTAVRLLQTLAGDRCNWDDAVDHLLEKCTAAYHDKEHEFSIIYGDYYFIEGIFKLTGEELFLW